jgi:hypothetical protein
VTKCKTIFHNFSQMLETITLNFILVTDLQASYMGKKNKAIPITGRGGL